MNKYKEALQIFNDYSQMSQFNTDHLQWADETLYELVYKATPKKPTTINGELCCPNCKQSSRLSTYESDCYPEYNNANCGNCGQALDWSDE